MRDTWGIPHVYGKTDADAVFGVVYAQAEDDFNRVETNFIHGMGLSLREQGLRTAIMLKPVRGAPDHGGH